MALNRVDAQVHPLNLASVRSLRRLGFVQEDVLRQLGFWRGQYHDMLQFSLLRSDWRPQPHPQGVLPPAASH